MGSIYKRGGVYWIKYYRYGKPFRESTKSHKEADAKRLLKKREGEIAGGKFPGIYFDRVTFDELKEDFLRDYRINQKKSLRRAERSAKTLEGFFSNMRVPDITTTKIDEYTDQRLEEGAANATINRELAALKRMFNLGVQQTPPKVAMVPYIRMLSENNVRKGFFEHGEFLAVKEALPEYLKTIVTFGYRFGWRVNEILSLTWDRVDLKNGIVRKETGETKNNEARTVYLNDELKEEFKALFINRRLDVPFVFLREDRPIKGFRKAWLKACSTAGVKGRLFHDLRRTAIRNMVRAGVSDTVSMKISGHKTRSVFDRYNIVSDEDLRQATLKQSAYLDGQCTDFETGTKTGTVADLDKKRKVNQNG